MNFFVKPYLFQSEVEVEKNWKRILDEFLQAKQVFEIPFEWKEIREMPIKLVKYVYKTSQDRYEKKMEALNKK